jgi:hypothetical protein
MEMSLNPAAFNVREKVGWLWPSVETGISPAVITVYSGKSLKLNILINL